MKTCIYQKNALVAVFTLVFSISIEIFYICAINFINDNITVILFILESVFNMIIYYSCYYRIKQRFMPEDALQYSKWQLIIPKRVGIGYALNFSCPLTYIILVILLIAIIVSLL